jgi:hypothetical protein
MRPPGFGWGLPSLAVGSHKRDHVSRNANELLTVLGGGRMLSVSSSYEIAA